MALPYKVTANGVIRRQAGFVVAAHLQSAAGAASTLVLRDGIDPVSEIRVSLASAIGESSDLYGARIPFYSAIYAEITGAPAFAQVEIEPI